MKPFLNLLEMEIPSVKSLRLSDKKHLLNLQAKVAKLRSVRGVSFFGPEDRLKPLQSIEQLIATFKNGKPDTYSFADAKDPTGSEAHVHWEIGIRKAFLTITAELEASAETMVELSNELLLVNQILLSAVPDGNVAMPFSFLRLPGTKFKKSQPPRFLGKLVPDSIVDIVYLKTKVDSDEQRIIDQLKSKSVPGTAERIVVDDFVVIRWGDLTKESPAFILARRYQWLVEGGEFGIHDSYNAAGDKEFALWQPVPTPEFTGYSPFDGRATKAVVFDEPSEVVDILEQMQRILASGKNSAGDRVTAIMLIVPSREAALALHPSAQRYGMGVIYVGDDSKLWNPFPAETETA